MNCQSCNEESDELYEIIIRAWYDNGQLFKVGGKPHKRISWCKKCVLSKII